MSTAAPPVPLVLISAHAGSLGTLLGALGLSLPEFTALIFHPAWLLCSRAPEEEEEESGSPAGSQCSPEQLALINGTQACGVLGAPRGPFAACHHAVAPEPFQA